MGPEDQRGGRIEAEFPADAASRSLFRRLGRPDSAQNVWTVGLDGQEVDVFVGTAGTGLVGACFTIDKRKGDQELKLLWNCTPPEIYLVHGFLNFAPEHMTSTLALRRPLAKLWDAYL